MCTATIDSPLQYLCHCSSLTRHRTLGRPSPARQGGDALRDSKECGFIANWRACHGNLDVSHGYAYMLYIYFKPQPSFCMATVKWCPLCLIWPRCRLSSGSGAEGEWQDMCVMVDLLAWGVYSATESAAGERGTRPGGPPQELRGDRTWTQTTDARLPRRPPSHPGRGCGSPLERGISRNVIDVVIDKTEEQTLPCRSIHRHTPYPGTLRTSYSVQK